jgi:ABC-type uncharacterized transport system permease subunit
MSLLSPLLALALTVLIGVVLFVLLGKDPLRGLQDVLRRAGEEPVCAVGAVDQGHAAGADRARPGVCFRANVWNIGAEGQFVLGAPWPAAGWRCRPGPAGLDGRGIVVAILLAGVLGGMLWAAIVALLRDRFNANEILVSLMLVYVAEMLLSWLVYGPWKDPKGYNFPQTITFDAITKIPRLVPGCAPTSAC